jgi:hypothetical protein
VFTQQSLIITRFVQKSVTSIVFVPCLNLCAKCLFVSLWFYPSIYSSLSSPCLYLPIPSTTSYSTHWYYTAHCLVRLSHSFFYHARSYLPYAYGHEIRYSETYTNTIPSTRYYETFTTTTPLDCSSSAHCNSLRPTPSNWICFAYKPLDSK